MVQRALPLEGEGWVGVSFTPHCLDKITPPPTPPHQGEGGMSVELGPLDVEASAFQPLHQGVDGA